jgi:hypothetical protein
MALALADELIAMGAPQPQVEPVGAAPAEREPALAGHS